ncbi:MAG: hypothetical protein KatS3mg012_0404 [Gaiellaceae bacterium]|nr:MAG: hypothetical protein KatS3mg012_0404 [Gaiellaceae bacterium]
MLPFAVGVAVVPIPVVAVILLLLSGRPRANRPAFAVGWALGLAGAFVVIYAIADGAGAATDEQVSDGVSWLEIALGVALLLLARRTWRTRPSPGTTRERPAWMAGIESLQPGRALGLGLLLSAGNPKNLALDGALRRARGGLPLQGPRPADRLSATRRFESRSRPCPRRRAG